MEKPKGYRRVVVNQQEFFFKIGRSNIRIVDQDGKGLVVKYYDITGESGDHDVIGTGMIADWIAVNIQGKPKVTKPRILPPTEPLTFWQFYELHRAVLRTEIAMELAMVKGNETYHLAKAHRDAQLDFIRGMMRIFPQRPGEGRPPLTPRPED